MRGPLLLFRNDGLGRFDEVSATSLVAGTRFYWTPILFDFNRDGLLDIFVAVDFAPNQLWINQGSGVFEEVAADAGVNNAWNDMGVALGDYDNDGDFDLYITEVESTPAGRHNVLYRNDSVAGALQFTDVAPFTGVASGSWGWGTTFFDSNLDGRPDLIATNGFDGEAWREDRTRFFANVGGNPTRFIEQASVMGLDDADYGSCVIAADLDRDGDADLAQSCNLGGPLRVLRNLQREETGGNWLTVVPRMAGANANAIGAVVRLRTRSGWQARAITAGISFMGQEPAEAHFGLGAANRIKGIVVEWPDGRVSRHRDIAVNQTLVVYAP